MSGFGDFISSSGGGSALSFIGGIADNIFANRRAKKQFQYDKQLASQQHQFNLELANHNFGKNLEMWRMENAYNSPQSQMKRYTDAGLNPNFMMSNISSGNSTGNLPTMDAQPNQLARYQVPQMKFNFLKDIFATILQAKQVQADIDLKKSNQNYMDQLATSEVTKNLLYGSQYDLNKQLFGHNEKLHPTVLEDYKAKIFQSRQQGLKSYWDAITAKRSLNSRLALLNAQEALTSNQAHLAQEQFGLASYDRRMKASLIAGQNIKNANMRTENAIKNLDFQRLQREESWYNDPITGEFYKSWDKFLKMLPRFF